MTLKMRKYELENVVYDLGHHILHNDCTVYVMPHVHDAAGPDRGPEVYSEHQTSRITIQCMLAGSQLTYAFHRQVDHGVFFLGFHQK